MIGLYGLLLAPLIGGTALSGTWLQDCDRGHQKQEVFYAGSAVYSEMNFADAACTQAEIEMISEGGIQLGPEVRIPEGARQIDFVFSGVFVRLWSERAVASYNSRAICGISDWAAGKERDVTGRECDFFGLGRSVQVPVAGEPRFGVVKEESDSLFFGQLSPKRDGKQPQRRPTELDPHPYRFLPFR